MSCQKLTVPVLMLGLLAGANAARAGAIPYPNIGQPNPITYTFTAATSGPLTVYEYATSFAGDYEVVGLLDNGVQLGGLGLEDKGYTVAGDSYTFGNVTAGDTLTFFIIDYTTGDYWYSDPSLNPANENHVYSAYYAGGDPSVPSDVPAGIYIGFEDTGFTQGSDENYSDEQFVFANTSSPEVAAPEPASMLMLGSALIGLASARSRSRRTV